jgi:hypothetical protein
LLNRYRVVKLYRGFESLRLRHDRHVNDYKRYAQRRDLPHLCSYPSACFEQTGKTDISFAQRGDPRTGWPLSFLVWPCLVISTQPILAIRAIETTGLWRASVFSRLSWFLALSREIAGTTIVTIGELPTAGCRRLTAAGRIVTQACSRQLRSDSGEQYAQLGRLRLAAGPDNGWLVIDVLRLGYGPWCGARGDRWAAASRLAG